MRGRNKTGDSHDKTHHVLLVGPTESTTRNRGVEWITSHVFVVEKNGRYLIACKERAAAAELAAVYISHLCSTTINRVLLLLLLLL